MVLFQGGGDIVYEAEGQDGAGGTEFHPFWGRGMALLEAVTQVHSCWDLPSWWVTRVSLPRGCVPSRGRTWSH